MRKALMIALLIAVTLNWSGCLFMALDQLGGGVKVEKKEGGKR